MDHETPTAVTVTVVLTKRDANRIFQALVAERRRLDAYSLRYTLPPDAHVHKLTERARRWSLELTPPIEGTERLHSEINEGAVMMTTTESAPRAQQLKATYNDDGQIIVSSNDEAYGHDLGFHDADGEAWDGSLDKIITAHGYRRIGRWYHPRHGDWSEAPVVDMAAVGYDLEWLSVAYEAASIENDQLNAIGWCGRDHVHVIDDAGIKHCDE